MDRNRSPRGLAAHYALPVGFTALLVTGALAAGLGGRLPATGVLILAAAVVLAISAVSEPLAAPVLGVIGWLTVAGFSHPPYAQLRMTGPVAARAAVTMAVCMLAGAGTGLMVRRLASRFRLGIVRVHGERPEGRVVGRAGITGPVGETLRAGLRGRRQVAGILLVAGLPLLTLVLTALRPHLDLANDLLVYLVAVVAVAVVGGFWPAVLAAITASLLLNWYFTRPLHTLTIAEPRNMLALLLFVTVAVTVSSVVHLAARRQVLAARSAGEAASLLELAQTVLGGADTPTAVLDHLTIAWGGRAELAERVRDQWVSVAVSGAAPPEAVATQVPVSGTVALIVAGQSRPITSRLLDGFAAQAGAALDRDRLRTQAAQAEALAEGNRMRTALLAAVSHDLRTPLASIKASVSTLRQTDVEWTAADEAALLATIEDGADRLDVLIGNLLDMSRLATGSLQPFLRPTSVEEVAPAALLGLAPASSVLIAVPDDLPLVRTDPVLLERVLANLFSNALAHSPAGQPPELRAGPDGGIVRLEVLDHGPGVPDQFKLRMFEPFERLGDRAAGNGVGLGLAVAKGFLAAMGGTIHAADTPGGGLTVQVSLPVAAVAAEPVAPPAQ
jgi:two-component system, OmpR family, sensor histidine kinase KdpD